MPRITGTVVVALHFDEESPSDAQGEDQVRNQIVADLKADIASYLGGVVDFDVQSVDLKVAGAQPTLLEEGA